MKTLFRYRLLDNLKALAIVAGALAAICAFFSITFGETEVNGANSLTGAIWALVIGIVTTRIDLRLGNQMGTSRRSAFLANLLGNLAVFAIASVGLTVLTALLQIMSDGSQRFVVTDLYQILYSTSGNYVMTPGEYGMMALLSFVLFAAMGSFGMLCTTAFWRVNKVGAWILGLSLGLGLSVGFPNLMYRLSPYLIRPLRILTTNVWAMILFLLVWAVVFLLGTWLLARRAVIKPAAK